MSDRINARLPKPLADHVSRMVGQDSIFETPSEYIRSLIRKDMESEFSQVYTAVIDGFTDIKEGRYMESTGDWKKDKELFLKKQSENWQ
ncbi:antitoxin ParD1/3/4 [Kordia periserrulae]|uniref:Antitoxin ParD1/3/4 n=1 Tax=Kordia periserrulae TaxID=701523 RepID=A0A2T6BRG9_9FLAO|nr:CopG family transcriptional regulator [Kordia periserrulae]PTX58577.1 antitoxin ParD1/3/4 [Kordia periserrulae]